MYLKLLGQEHIKNTYPLCAYEIRPMGSISGVELEGIYPEEILRQHLVANGNSCSTFLLEGRGSHWRVVFVGLPCSVGIDLRRYSNEKMQQLIADLNDRAAGEFTFHLTHSVAQLAELLTETEVKGPSQEQQQVDGTLCETVIADYKLLIVELDLGSKETLLHLLSGMLYRLKDAPFEDVQFALKNLYSVIELDYRKRKINVWDITNGKFNFNHLYRAKNINSVSESLKEDFCALCDGLKSRKPSSEHGVVGRLVQYLNEHLDEDVAHNEIAAKYRIHPGYLSRLFKQEMGETLSEYLLRIRIERAAGLLKDGRHKIGDIAGMVGYSASSYFSIMFKKYTGYSPREYTQRVSL